MLLNETTMTMTTSTINYSLSSIIMRAHLLTSSMELSMHTQNTYTCVTTTVEIYTSAE
jgi:hypothetical protein